jgi:hypothetical protein
MCGRMNGFEVFWCSLLFSPLIDNNRHMYNTFKGDKYSHMAIFISVIDMGNNFIV